jgi:hypothetical protein
LPAFGNDEDDDAVGGDGQMAATIVGIRAEQCAQRTRQRGGAARTCDSQAFQAGGSADGVLIVDGYRSVDPARMSGHASDDSVRS